MSIVLRYGPVLCSYTASRDVEPALVQAFRIANPAWSPDKARGQGGDGDDVPKHIDLVDVETRQLPTGIATHVEHWAATYQIPVQRDGWPEPCNVDVPLDTLPDVQLYPFQADAVRALIRAQRGVCEIATGGGKGEVSKALIGALGKPRTVFTVPDTAALHAIASRFQAAFGDDVGRFGDKLRELDRRIVVATIGSLYSGVKRRDAEVRALLDEAQLFIGDEAHHYATAPSWQIVGMECQAPYRFAMSGTPFNTPGGGGLADRDPEDMLLQAVTGPLVVSMSVAELTRTGYLTPCEVLPFPVAGPYLRTWSWQRVYEHGVVRNEPRNAAVALLAANLVDMGRYPLISVERLDHGRTLQYMLRRLGVLSVCAYGDATFIVPVEVADRFGTEQRVIPVNEAKPGKGRGRRKRPTPATPYAGTYRRGGVEYEGLFVALDVDDPSRVDQTLQELFQRGDFGVLIGSRIYDEVQNVLFLTDLINAAGFRRAKRVRQKVGRVLRRYPRKRCARVWEPQDTCHKMLERHSTERVATLAGDGHRVVQGEPLVECWLWLRDYVRLGRVIVRLKDVEVSVELAVPAQEGAGVRPRITLRAELDDVDDPERVAWQLGVRATAMCLREAISQTYWHRQALTQGLEEASAQHKTHYLDMQQTAFDVVSKAANETA